VKFQLGDTIVAPVTPPVVSAIAVIRISGAQALSLTVPFLFRKNSKSIGSFSLTPNSVHFAVFKNGEEIIDEVLVSYFRSPFSYTGEDVVEVSLHGSPYIRQRVMQVLLEAGARHAEPGEFTLRAFLNGKMDLSQAEAVADLIESNSGAAHAAAMSQMRGGYSQQIRELRQQLVGFASLIELELDFSEEDVEFADRGQLKKLLEGIQFTLGGLLKSFEIGNVLKHGVPVAIAGKPNAGKSTLLNTLMNEEKAIVSEIPGTTRDAIEDTLSVNGVLFRLIDTAGLRKTEDVIENMGVKKAMDIIGRATLVLYLFDASTVTAAELEKEIAVLKQGTQAQFILVGNKSDITPRTALSSQDIIYISARNKSNISALQEALVHAATHGMRPDQDVIVTNARHAASLKKALFSVEKVSVALEAGLPGDLLALDIREALDELGGITGEVSNEDLLENIFRNFCIGK
jgi:tRNA modification GTPase